MYLKADSKGRDKFDCRWESGVWLGIRDEIGEIIVGTAEGVVKSRDFMRLGSSSDRWNAEFVAKFVGTPWEPVPGTVDDSISVRVRVSEEGESIAPNPDTLGVPKSDIKRRARITREDIV